MKTPPPTWGELTRLVLDFVNLYISPRRQHFREALNPPCGDWAASQTERRRIAQALLRSQILVSMHHPCFDKSPGAYSFFTTAVRLFESWELEQTSAMATFVADLIYAFRGQDESWPRSEPLPAPNRYHPQRYLSLPALYKELVVAQWSNDDLLPVLRREPSLCGGKMLRWGSLIG